MIRIIRFIIDTVFYRLIFNSISRINFRFLMNGFITQLLTMSTFDLLSFFRALILNRLRDNTSFRLMETTIGFQTNLLFDQSSKRAFWSGFILTILIYNWSALFKKLILWPFKLGIYTFLYAISGIDFSWFLGWFDLFKINIPKWVYFQYLSLYNNWVVWWYNMGKIKSLSTESIPSISIESENTELLENKDKINKKKIYVILGVIILISIGVGLWYYFDFGGTGGGGNPNNPPNVIVVNPVDNLPHQIDISDNQPSSSSSSRRNSLIPDQAQEFQSS